MNAPVSVSNSKPTFAVADASHEALDAQVDSDNLLPDRRNDKAWHRVSIAPGRDIEVRLVRADSGQTPVFEARGRSGAIVALRGFRSFSDAASNAAEKARGGAITPFQANPLQSLANVKMFGKTLGQLTNEGVQDVARFIQNAPVAAGFTPKQVMGAYNRVVPTINRAVTPITGRPLAVTIPGTADKPEWLSTVGFAGVQKGSTVRQTQIGYMTNGLPAARVPDPKRPGEYRIYTAADLKLSGADALSLDAVTARVRKLLADPKSRDISSPIVTKATDPLDTPPRALSPKGGNLLSGIARNANQILAPFNARLPTAQDDSLQAMRGGANLALQQAGLPALHDLSKMDFNDARRAKADQVLGQYLYGNNLLGALVKLPGGKSERVDHWTDLLAPSELNQFVDGMEKAVLPKAVALSGVNDPEGRTMQVPKQEAFDQIGAIKQQVQDYFGGNWPDAARPMLGTLDALQGYTSDRQIDALRWRLTQSGRPIDRLVSMGIGFVRSANPVAAIDGLVKLDQEIAKAHSTKPLEQALGAMGMQFKDVAGVGKDLALALARGDAAGARKLLAGTYDLTTVEGQDCANGAINTLLAVYGGAKLTQAGLKKLGILKDPNASALVPTTQIANNGVKAGGLAAALEQLKGLSQQVDDAIAANDLGRLGQLKSQLSKVLSDAKDLGAGNRTVSFKDARLAAGKALMRIDEALRVPVSDAPGTSPTAESTPVASQPSAQMPAVPNRTDVPPKPAPKAANNVRPNTRSASKGAPPFNAVPSPGNVPIVPAIAGSGMRQYKLHPGPIGSVPLSQSGRGDVVPPASSGTVGAQGNPNKPSRDSIQPEQLMPGFDKMSPDQKVTAIKKLLGERPLTPEQVIQIRMGKLPADVSQLLQSDPTRSSVHQTPTSPVRQTPSSVLTSPSTPGAGDIEKNSVAKTSGATGAESPGPVRQAQLPGQVFSEADKMQLRQADKVVVLGFSSTGGGHTARSMEPLLTAIDTPSALYGTRGSKVINPGDVILIVKPPHWESDAGNEAKQLQKYKAAYEGKGIHVIEAQQDKSLFGFYKQDGPSDNIRILEHFVNMDARDPNARVPAYGSGELVPAFDAKDIIGQAVQASGDPGKFTVFTDMDPYTAEGAVAAGIPVNQITDQSNHIGLMAPGVAFDGKSVAYLTLANTPGAGNTALIGFDANINRLSRLADAFKQLQISPTTPKQEVRRQMTELLLREGKKLPLDQPVGTAGGILVAPAATPQSIDRIVYLYLNAYTGPLGRHIQDKLNEQGDNAFKHTLFVVAGGQTIPGHNAMNLVQLANADGIVAGGMGTTTEAHQLLSNGYQGKTIVMPVEDQHEQQTNAHQLLPAALSRDLPEGSVTTASDNADLQQRVDDLVNNRATRTENLTGDMQALFDTANSPNRVTDQPVNLLDGGAMTPQESNLNRINTEKEQRSDALAMRRLVNAVLPALKAALGNETNLTVKMGAGFEAQTLTLKELATTLRNRSKAAELLHAPTSGPETRKLLQEAASRLDAIANATDPERRRNLTTGFLQELANNRFVLGY